MKAKSHPDCAVCARRKTREAAREKANYQKAKASGGCIGCSAKAAPGLVRCLTCNNAHIDREFMKRHPDAEAV